MNVPKLRFKEFDGEWEENSLAKLATFSKGKGISKDNLSTDGKPCILYGELYTKYKEVASTIYSRTNIESSDLIKSEKLDVLIPSSGETAKDIACSTCIIQEDVLIGGDLNILRFGKEIDGRFISYQINGIKKLELSKYAQGATVVHLYSQGIKKLRLNIPTIEEQKKISELLLLLNKKIQLQQQKIDLLQEQKKGYMQEIFSQENKNLKYIKLEDAFDERNEKGFPEYELLAVTLKNGVTDRTDMKKDTSSDDKSNYKRVKVGDIAYNSMRMWQGASGYSNYNGIVSPAYTVLIPKKNIDSQFFAYLFKTNFMIYQFKKYSQGLTSDTWNLKYPLLKEIKVKIPSLDQQKRIVEFFTKIDLYINLQKKRLDILKNQKKGFMQQMFI